MKAKLKQAFTFGDVVRRAIGSWILTAWCILLVNDGNFYSRDFLISVKIIFPVVLFTVLFCALSVLAYFIRQLRTDSLSTLLGALLLALSWLGKERGVNEKRWLFCFTIIAALAIVIWDFLLQNGEFLKNFRFSEKAPVYLMVICGVICAGIISVVTCLRYINYAAPTFDFGIFVQMFHNMSETFRPETTCERNELLSHFAVHLSPICYILLPFYYIFPSPLTLQIGQAVVVASGIVPFYLIMRHWNFSAKARTGFCIAYMLFPIISRGCFYDFHENCFLLPLLLWLFWAYETERIPFIVLFTVLCCMVKEDVAVYVSIFALYAILSGETKKRKLFGVGMLAFAVCYFLFATWYINSFGEGIMSGRYENCSADGSLIGIIYTAFANPGLLLQQLTGKGWNSVLYILAFLVPLGFLPLVTKKTVRYILLLPIFLNLLTDWEYQLELIYQYHFGISAFFLFASIMNYQELSEGVRRYLLALCMASALILHSYLITPEIPYRIQQYQNGKAVYQQINDAIEVIPEDASVVANSYILPHLANRKEIYPLRNDLDYNTAFIVLDMRSATDQEAFQFYVTNGYRPYSENECVAILVNIYWEAENIYWYESSK